LSIEEVWGLHRELIEEYNNWVDEYCEADQDESNKGVYETVRYIK